MIKNKSIYLSKKDCNPRGTNSGSNPNCILKRAKKGAGFIKAKTTSAIPSSVLHANEEVLARLTEIDELQCANKEDNHKKEVKSLRVHTAVVPVCLWLKCELSLATD